MSTRIIQSLLQACKTRFSKALPICFSDKSWSRLLPLTFNYNPPGSHPRTILWLMLSPALTGPQLKISALSSILRYYHHVLRPTYCPSRPTTCFHCQVGPIPLSFKLLVVWHRA